MSGKRAGARRGARPSRRLRHRLALLAIGITLLVIAWGYLVYAAIDFGSAARGGQGSAWAFLGLASLGAVACLFAGLMLGARALRELGMGPEAVAAVFVEDAAAPPRLPGGRRAAR